MNRAFVATLSLVALAACGGARAGGAKVEIPVASAPDVELRDGGAAYAAGASIPMDGVPEGLAWPALRKALARKPGDHAPLAIAVARGVPLSLVLRAVWTLRDADVRVQSADPMGTVHVIELRPKPDAPPSATDAECHAAAFLEPNGDVRVAAPGGAHVLPARGAPAVLASSLAAEATHCPIRYLGFGAESPDATWGSVFDLARAVDEEKSAGDARYVLAEPVHASAR